MNLKKVIHNYIIYNHWANEKLIQWLKSLDPEILYKEIQSSFASIDLTLQHMKNAQTFWFAVIRNEEIERLDETIKIKSFDSVTEELLKGSQKMIDVYTAFTDQQLIAAVTSPVMTRTRYDFMLHVINHNSYHRGQIITIARLLGVRSNIPETDYDTFLWFDQKSAGPLGD